MFSLRYFMVLFCFLMVDSIEATIVNKCGNSIGLLPPVVEISDCEDMPCIFLLGTNVSVSMAFNSPSYLEHFAPTATAIKVLGLLDVPYPLDQTDACDGVTNTPCPIAKGEYVEYNFAMNVLSGFPTIAVTIEFGLLDQETNSTIVCFSVNAQIAKPDSS